MRKIQKGDTVKIITGKDRGSTGVVSKVLVKDNKVVIEGKNLYKKNIKATSENEGMIVEKAMPMHISNVMLMDGKEATRVSFKDEKGKKVRVATKSGKVIK